MKIYIFKLLIAFIIISSYGLSQTSQWSKLAGGVQNDNVSGFDIDKYGNSYITGVFYDSISFGTTSLKSNGLTSIFIAKYDINGKLEWANNIATDSIISSSGICVDNAGNIILIGNFAKFISFGNSNKINLISKGDYEVFLTKFSNNGELLWATSFGEIGLDNATKITTDYSDNIYVVGEYHLTSYPYSSSKLYLSKFDSLGKNIWQRITQTYGVGHYINDLKIDSKNNLFITGEFFDAIEFEPTAILKADNIESNAFVAKFSSEGYYLWGNKAGSIYGYAGSKVIEIDSLGNSFIAGYFRGSIDLGQLSISGSSDKTYDMFVAKCDIDGNFLWVNQSEGTASPKSINLINNGNMLISGTFNKSINFIPFTLNTLGGIDIFVVKLNKFGNYLSAFSFGGPSSDLLSGMKTNSSGIYFSGNFIDKIDFGNSNILKGINSFSSDIFLTKFDYPSSILIDEKISINSIYFPNPVENFIELNSLIDYGIIKVYNSLGIKVIESENTCKIDFSNLTSDVYYLKSLQNTYKIIKK
jgi:hypothetical protein